MEQIRVIHVLGRLGSGGVEKLLVTLLENMNHEEVIQDYLLFDAKEGFYDDYVKSLGSKLHYVESKSYPVRILTRIDKQRNLFQFLKMHPYEIVQFHGTQPATYFQAYLARKAGIRNVIVHAHNTKSLTTIRTKILPLFKTLFCKYPTYYLACSQEAADYMWPNGLEKDKGYVLINGINIDAYSFSEDRRRTFRKENNLEGKYVIGHIGRFEVQKNHQFLLKVFKGVQDRIPNSILLLIGEGKMIEQIREMANQMGIGNNVNFFGTAKDIPSALMGMDVMCFPSFYEGLGIVAVEAQAASLPVVVSEGVPESANISEFFYKLQLNDPLQVWVDKVSGFNHLTRGGVCST